MNITIFNSKAIACFWGINCWWQTGDLLNCICEAHEINELIFHVYYVLIHWQGLLFNCCNHSFSAWFVYEYLFVAHLCYGKQNSESFPLLKLHVALHWVGRFWAGHALRLISEHRVWRMALVRAPAQANKQMLSKIRIKYGWATTCILFFGDSLLGVTPTHMGENYKRLVRWTLLFMKCFPHAIVS